MSEEWDNSYSHATTIPEGNICLINGDFKSLFNLSNLFMIFLFEIIRFCQCV